MYMPVADIPELEPISQAERAGQRWRWLLSIMRLLVVLVLAAAAGGGWYLARKGFGRQWRALVVEELHQHGVEASVRRLTLDPFRGLVAQDVRIFDYKHRENTIAQISRLSLDVNYAALFQRLPFLNAVDIRDANVTLPLPAGAPAQAPRAEIKGLRAHIYFPPEQIFVSQAEGTFCGIRISATGQLIKRNDYQPSHRLTEGEWQQRLALLQKVVSELDAFRFSSPPELQLKFAGDVAQLERARVEARLRAPELGHGNYQGRNFVLVAEFAERTLSISDCSWQDDLGAFEASANWKQADDLVEFQGRSTLNLQALVESFGKEELLAGLRLIAPPRLDFSGTSRMGEGSPRWQVSGHGILGQFSYRTIAFAGGDADFSWDGTRAMLRDVHLQHQSGTITAELLLAPGEFRLELSSSVDPNALLPLTPAGLRDFVAEWNWPHSGNVQLAVHGPSPDSATWQGEGKIRLDRGRFRRVSFNNLTSDLRFGDGAVTYGNFRVTRDEGEADGTLVYDFLHQEARLINIVSRLRPAEAILWVDPKLLKVISPYQFEGAPTIIVNGVYQFHGGKGTRIELAITSAARMNYVFLGKTLPFDRIDAKLLLERDRLQVLELNGALFSGAVRGSADVSLVRGDERYRASVAVDRVEFPRLTQLYFNDKTAHGFLDGAYEWSGLGPDARSMNGAGNIEVRNGDVFAIPVFGPLSDLLNNLLPGVGYRVARKATASFTIKNGIIKMPDLHVEAGSFGMIGHGNAHFLEDQIDFDVRIDASGAGFVLTPLYKFFEYTAQGSLAHPTWRAKNF